MTRFIITPRVRNHHVAFVLAACPATANRSDQSLRVVSGLPEHKSLWKRNFQGDRP